MGRGASAKLNHAKIRQAVIDVLSIRNAIKYEDFKEQVAKQYDVLTGQNIVNRNDWRAAWRRCSRSALLVLNEETDWLKITNRILTNIYFEGKPDHQRRIRTCKAVYFGFEKQGKINEETIGIGEGLSSKCD